MNLLKFTVMRQKNSPTILERAVNAVPEFEEVMVKLSNQVTLRGQSKSTLNNYTRRIALCVLHFKQLPEELSEDEINEYLVALARDPKSPSRSSFKHMVYGLRYYFRLLGMNKKAIALPSLKQDAKLPVKHYHIIFTVPHCLNDVCLWNAKVYYNLLFSSVWDTLRSFGYTHFGSETGAVAVLHSWGQNLSLHPHLHCLVPAAGFSLKGQWKTVGKNGRMHIKKEIPRIRSPAKHLPSLLLAACL